MPFAGHAGIALITSWLLGINPLITLIGGVLPDLDVVLTMLGVNFNKAHRKITHSLLFIIILLPLLLTPSGYPLIIGVITHLITDLDHWGLPLLYPLSNKHYSIMSINHSKNLSSTNEGIIKWFTNRGIKFWIEWALLIIGLILTRDYWLKLLSL